MKLKCVALVNGAEEYLTAGLVYDVVLVGYSGLLDIIDDTGGQLSIFAKNSAHGKFEVIHED